MKEFLITVNGKTYEVQVEEVGENPNVVAPIPAAPNPAPKATPIPIPAAPVPEVKPLAAKPTGASSGANSGAVGKTTIKCPMPGTIVKINVNVGDSVKSGKILCILEAMKMENELLAPGDGVVVSVNTAKGANVNSGDILFTID